RAPRPHRAPQWRADRGPAGSDLDGGTGREPRAGYRAQARLRDLLDLYRPLHPCAFLRLRLSVRRLPGELALCGLREGARWLRRTLPGDARRRRHQASLGAARAVRARCARPGVLARRAVAAGADDRGAGGAGLAHGERAADRYCRSAEEPLSATLTGLGRIPPATAAI